MAAALSWIMDSSDYAERSPLFPNPLVCLRDMAQTAAYEFYDRLVPWNGCGVWFEETWVWVKLIAVPDPLMMVWAAVICVLLTAVRENLNRVLFKPFAQRSKLERDSAEKLPESMWKGSIYLLTWTWSAYLTHKWDTMFDLASHWNTIYPGQPVPDSLYWLFTFEVGFYLHSIYGMLFMEQRRKDFAVLFLHHILTMALIVTCYTVRFHVIGLYLIFIHDIGDVFLEYSKCVNYFKIQDGRKNMWAELGANVGFLLFTVQFFLFRLYWFFTKALYSTLHVCMVVHPYGPFYLPFNIMLLALLAMQIYWFGLIVQMLIKVLILREKLSDIRDYEEEEEEEGEEEGTEGDKKRLEGGGGRDRWGEERRGAIRNGHMAPQKTEKMH